MLKDDQHYNFLSQRNFPQRHCDVFPHTNEFCCNDGFSLRLRIKKKPLLKKGNLHHNCKSSSQL